VAARPPLNAIFVFCAAARHGSFKLAAETLCVTPGAVSRQIQALEEYLGQPLFERGHRDVRLTRAGKRLQHRLAGNMASVEAEVELMRSGARKTTVRVDAGVTIAMHWLIPRLAAFHAANPGYQVQLSTSNGPVDACRRVDLHIRRDPADFSGLKPERFLEEYSLLVASRELVDRQAAFSLRALKRYRRIGAASRQDLWTQWSAQHELDAADYEPTLEFDNTVLAIQATVEGLGVMVAPEIFIADMLGSGVLVCLDSTRVRTGAYYFLRRARRETAGVGRFIDWFSR